MVGREQRRQDVGAEKSAEKSGVMFCPEHGSLVASGEYVPCGCGAESAAVTVWVQPSTGRVHAHRFCGVSGMQRTRFALVEMTLHPHELRDEVKCRKCWKGGA